MYDSVKWMRMFEILICLGLLKKFFNVSFCLKDTRRRVLIGDDMSEIFKNHNEEKNNHPPVSVQILYN